MMARMRLRVTGGFLRGRKRGRRTREKERSLEMSVASAMRNQRGS
jgi:hypothetical protein